MKKSQKQGLKVVTADEPTVHAALVTKERQRLPSYVFFDHLNSLPIQILQTPRRTPHLCCFDGLFEGSSVVSS